jgi:prophage DNA circulation protein
MAWSETLLDCSFRGFVFDIFKTQDAAERATAEHSYPYVDGADIEDLGGSAGVIAIDAFFWGDDYETRLQAFLKLLDEPGTGELIHPVFGSIKQAQFLRRTVVHDAEHVDQCILALEFKISTTSNPFFDRTLPSQRVDLIGLHGMLTRSALADSIGKLIDTLRNASPLATLNALRQQMVGPILATFSQTQGVLLTGLDVLAFPRAWASDVSSIVDGVLDLGDFGDTLIYDWTSAGNVLSLFDVFSSGSSTEPAPVQVRIGSTPTESQAVAACQAHLTASTAIGYADAAALVLTAEADPQHGATLSPPEIELVVDGARTRVESAIAAIRAIYPLETARSITEPLKDQALALQEAARAIIEARPPLIQKTVELPGNLRLLAHRWYGDHTRALELLRLNPGLRSPNALTTGDVVNAYAR